MSEFDISTLFTSAAVIPLLTLCALELVLGIDNLIFISILAAKLPPEQQKKARFTGLSLAVITRIILLFSLSWVMSLTDPLFTLLEKTVSGRDLILILGGLFLVGKSTVEIHHKLEGDPVEDGVSIKKAGFGFIVFQILLLDIVFSLDSVITAIGMVDQISIMVVAVLISTVVMIVIATPLSDFVDRNPTIKILALSFLILIGVTLVAEGFGQHISKGYIYFAMAFSLLVEFINIKMRKNATPIVLRK